MTNAWDERRKVRIPVNPTADSEAKPTAVPL